jgi:para-nitrobenzyl esterase
MKLDPGVTREGVIQSATDLASDRFIAYSTWKWCDLHSKTGNSVVYRYYYARPRPAVRLGTGNASKGLDGGGPKGPGANAPQMPAVIGAVHSAEIEYAMGNLSTNRVYDWQPEDYKISSILQEYFANFIKTGNPNGMGLPVWSPFTSDGTGKVMIIDVNTRSEDEKNRGRYLWLDQIYNPGT